jgi:hypothetical protein
MQHGNRKENILDRMALLGTAIVNAAYGRAAKSISILQVIESLVHA